jgi:AcrR family transcriptional regulator
MVKVKSEKKKPLSVERIALCALKIADKVGLEQLSMRKIADALRVEAMSLYHHVPSKASLMEAMVEQLTLELPPMPPSSGWRRDLTVAAQQWRTLALKHPGTFALLATRAQTPRELLERFAMLLAALTEAGFSLEAAASGLNSFFFALNGYLLAAGEPVVFREIPEPTSFPELGPQAAAIFSKVPAKVWDLPSEESFLRHVEFLLEAFAARAP